MKMFKWLTYGLLLVFLSTAQVANAMDTNNSRVGITFVEGSDTGEEDVSDGDKITENPNLNLNNQFPQTGENNYSQQIIYIGVGIILVGGILLYKKERRTI